MTEPQRPLGADDQPPHVDGQDELFPDPRTTTEVPF